MKRRAVIEEAVGETRAAIYEGRHLVELYVRRTSEAARPHIGDIFCGKVGRVDKDMAAAFVNLGYGSDGVLKFSSAAGAPRFQEGQRIEVEITREAEAEKGPVLKFRDMCPEAKPGRMSGDNLREFLVKRFGETLVFEEASVQAVDEATPRDIAIPGGGTLTIETTRALIAIDIDKGGATSGFAVAQAAMPLIARQLRLRGLGGLIVIDVPNLRQPRQREQIVDMLKEAFASDPHMVKIAPMSRFGVIEMTRSRMGRSLGEILNDRFGFPTLETQALRALYQLERAGRVSPGAQLTLTVPQTIYDWLEVPPFNWHADMEQRLGARFSVSVGDTVYVESDR